MKTKICDMLDIKHPIIQGAMAWIGTAELAAATSNAGGLGIIHPFTERGLDKEIEIARKITDKPFGINIPILSPGAKRAVKKVIDEGITVVTASVGDPVKFTKKLQDEGVCVIQVVTNLAHARRAGEAKVDCVVASGIEAGGHPGRDEITTLSLVPQVIDALDIPIIAAGGICDARGLASAIMLGAEGVQMGTRFIATDECIAHDDFKQAILNATDVDTTVIGRGIFPSRVIKNEFSNRFEGMDEKKKSREMLTEIERAKAAMLRGDLVEGSMWCGQCAGSINEVISVEAVIKKMIEGAEDIISNKAILISEKA